MFKAMKYLTSLTFAFIQNHKIAYQHWSSYIFNGKVNTYKILFIVGAVINKYFPLITHDYPNYFLELLVVTSTVEYRLESDSFFVVPNQLLAINYRN